MVIIQNMKGSSSPLPLPTPHSHSQEAVPLASSFFFFFSQQKWLNFIAGKLGRASRLYKGLCRNSHRWSGLPGPRSVWKAGQDQHTSPFGPSWAQGSRPWLLGAEVGNSLRCVPQGLQQSVHDVLGVDANLAGQVSVKLGSCLLVERLTDCVRAAFTSHIHRDSCCGCGCGGCGCGGGGSRHIWVLFCYFSSGI